MIKVSRFRKLDWNRPETLEVNRSYLDSHETVAISRPIIACFKINRFHLRQFWLVAIVGSPQNL